MKANMYPATAAALAALVFTVNSQADVDDRLQKTFEVAPGGALRIEADRGGIEIKTADAAQVQVEVLRQVKLSDRDKAERILKDHELTLTQEGDTIEVRAKFKTANRSFWNRDQQYLQVHYTVTVPRKFNLNLATAGGGIIVPDLTGKLTCTTAGGSLRLGRIEGPVDGQTAGGSINLAGGTEAVNLHTAGGSISVGEAGANLEAETAGGSIHIKKAHGQVKAKTAGGSIELGEVSGKVYAQTSGGSVTATLAGQPKDDCDLATSAGGITLTVPGDAAINVDAETAGGRVISDLPTTVQGELHRSSLKGKINGGGPRMHLRTSAGNIHIKKK